MGYKAPATHRKAYVIKTNGQEKRREQSIFDAKDWARKHIKPGESVQIFYDQTYGELIPVNSVL